jgi:outer membrane immunogenic protein
MEDSMKRLLVAGIAAAAFCGAPALAADLPMKAPPRAYVAPVPVINWTGCYIGGNLGGGWKALRSSDTDGFVEVDKTVSGFVGGGQIGCDYQSGPWVVGIQGMWDGSGVSASLSPSLATGPNAGDTINIKVSSFGTVAAKFGYLVNPTLQFYGKAGYGWVAEKSTFNCTALSCSVAQSPSVSQSRGGFDLGLGLTWMFHRNWDLFVEYDHIFLGTKELTYSLLTGTIPQDVRQSFDKVLVGIDYRFDMMGKAPVSAKY